jgi:acetyl-CoA C-acetyltransferase
MSDVFLSAGLRTPFVKAGGVYARHSALERSTPIVQRMRAQALPDLLVWGQVTPDPNLSNIARELVFEAGPEATIPAHSTVLACSTSPPMPGIGPKRWQITARDSLSAPKVTSPCPR